MAAATTRSALRRFLDHPAGPRTIHFWAPAMKWSLVIAGLGDLSRPASQLSLAQSTALAATGLIWSRYSMVIVPKNASLFAVNIFVAATGLYQIYRIWDYRRGGGGMGSSDAHREETRSVAASTSASASAS